MRVVCFSDIHLEAGLALGHPDSEVGNSRIRDARRVLEQIAQEDCDVLVFGGDAGRTARLGPTSYRVLQDALGSSRAKYRVLLRGNHDFTNEAACSLDVVAHSIDRAVMLDRARVVKAGGLQIGALPWAPPSRLFEQAPHNPREMNALLRDRLMDIARGLGTQIDGARPSLLVGHWLVSGSNLPVDARLLEASEPVLPSDDLTYGTGPWDVIVFGHNHTHAQLTEKLWVVGSPMRTSFGEQDHSTGYLRITWGEGPPTVEYVATDDRRLVTVDASGDEMTPPDVRDAVVRLRVHVRDGQQFDGRALVEALYNAGAHKVVGPQVQVERVVRQRAPEFSTDLAPRDALAKWLALADLPDDVRERAATLATEMMQ